ncbi:MAG: 2-hydroxyacid dehydrogenase [Tepidisphaeraceae bacterium]
MFDALPRESDVISIHIHMTPDNRHLINRDAFARMKAGVILLNTSRGGIIDETAFIETLNSGKVGGAGLDVIEGEWRTDLIDHPLVKYMNAHDNVVILPHLGGITWESRRMACEFTANKLAAEIERMARA